ncbi:MAG: helix-turn-helix domain-containing protein [Acidobacteria bacterium]|nr:helix-turn-helix domain-containing protein [Acidobacteriota bacterium]
MGGCLILHDARIEKNIPLAALSARTFLSPTIVRKIDEGRFDELPPGLYARSYVKSFAAEVGLDPGDALKAVEHLLPGAPDPLPVMRELKGPTVTDRFLAMAARFRTREGAWRLPERDVREEHDDPGLEHGVSAFQQQLVRLGCATVDAMVLLAMNGAVVLVVAIGTGLSPSSLLRQPFALATLCAVPTVLYFVLFGGIAGRTPGGWVCRMPESQAHAPLTLDTILRRSVAPGSYFDPQREGMSRPALVGRRS